jgi:hypothetical protein
MFLNHRSRRDKFPREKYKNLSDTTSVTDESTHSAAASLSMNQKNKILLGRFFYFEFNELSLFITRKLQFFFSFLVASRSPFFDISAVFSLSSC